MLAETNNHPIKVLELFAGIGGVHYAVRVIPGLKVIGAVDINTVTNDIYRHNFPDTALYQNNIQSLRASWLDKLKADLWTMSPPCQPFTLRGNRLGLLDMRSVALRHLLNCLQTMEIPPRMIFLENVIGFDGTSAHEMLLRTLRMCNYSYREYKLSPIDHGIPNSRPRYYLIATKSGDLGLPRDGHYITQLHEHVPPVPTLQEFLNLDDSVALELVPECNGVSSKNVVTRKSTLTACFTKRYTAFMRGCGSYLRMADGSAQPFTPRQVACLMCFPFSFSWPEGVTDRQVYAALGNSVNVQVVHELIAYLVHVDGLIS